ncbi:MAG: efflux RND transporter periplasmic adaptor subunit [Acidobacteriaceae bacterium]
MLITLGLRSLLRNDIIVSTATVDHNDLISTIPTNGKVEPIINFQAHSPISTTVRKVFVAPGDHVPAGKLLLTLDDADAQARLATAMAALRATQATLQATQQGGTREEQVTLAGQIQRARLEQQQASHDLISLQQLLARGAASQSEVASAQQRLQVAQSSLSSLEQRKTDRYTTSDLARAKAQLADAQAAYDAAQQVVNDCNVRAPFAGTVYSIPVQQSDYLQAGGELLQMADLSHIRVRAYFDEPEIGKLAVGQPVAIVWDAKPELSWHGHIERTPSTIIRYGTRNVGEVLIDVDDADGTLLPNTNVTVTVTTLRKQNVLSIPREALRTDGAVNYVFRVVDGKLRRTPVQIGVLNLTSVEILGGIQQGDVVALNAVGGQALEDGARVRVAK